jgi:hypothetical protein
MRPERPFPFQKRPARARLNAKPYPAVSAFIREIAVPKGRSAAIQHPVNRHTLTL